MTLYDLVGIAVINAYVLGILVVVAFNVVSGLRQTRQRNRPRESPDGTASIALLRFAEPTTRPVTYDRPARAFPQVSALNARRGA